MKRYSCKEYASLVMQVKNPDFANVIHDEQYQYNEFARKVTGIAMGILVVVVIAGLVAINIIH